MLLSINNFHISNRIIIPPLRKIKCKTLMNKMTMMTSNLSLLWHLKCSHLAPKTIMHQIRLTIQIQFSRELCSKMTQTLLMRLIIKLMTQRLFKWVDLVWMQINFWEITKITKLKTMKMMVKFSIERRLKKIKKNLNKVQLICKISWLKYLSKTLKHQTITKTVKSKIYTDSISTTHFKPCML